MISPYPGLLALPALAALLVLLRNWPRLLCGVALAGCAVPFFIPTSAPLLRAFALVFTCMQLVKALQFAAGHVQPRGWIDFGLFIFSFALVRWENPRRPDPRRAVFSALTGIMQLGLAWLLREVVLRLDTQNPVQLGTSQIGLYLVVAGFCNLSAVKLSLRGLDHVDGFNNPLGSLSPGEFWSRRWNAWISHLLHRYVFLPTGDRCHPLRGLLVAFAVSGAMHELFFDFGTMKFNGGMVLYFLLQGGLVAATSQSQLFRRLTPGSPGAGLVPDNGSDVGHGRAVRIRYG